MTHDEPRCWVLVVGMHRSGTSAVTGAVAHMGLALPANADLLATGRPRHPVHYESSSLSKFNEGLLTSRGGSWSAPPASGMSVEPPGVTAESQQARDLISTVYGTGAPAVWKDPRLCLLLPFWRTVLGSICGIVYIWRRPLEVAESLVVRNGFTLSHGLALWEWYNHHALLGMVGLPVFATSYDDIFEPGKSFARDAAAWLSEQVGVEATDVTVEGVVKPSLHHHHDANSRGSLLPEQEALVNVLDALCGPHANFAVPALPGVSPWTMDLLSARRDFERVEILKSSPRKAIVNAVRLSFSPRQVKHVGGELARALRRLA